LKLTPPLPAELMPGVLVSGSSEAGTDAARQLKATAVEYPKPPAEYTDALPANLASRGIRIGVIARSEDAEAWSVARARYPEDRTFILDVPASVEEMHHTGVVFERAVARCVEA